MHDMQSICIAHQHTWTYAWLASKMHLGLPSIPCIVIIQNTYETCIVQLRDTMGV